MGRQVAGDRKGAVRFGTRGTRRPGSLRSAVSRRHGRLPAGFPVRRGRDGGTGLRSGPDGSGGLCAPVRGHGPVVQPECTAHGGLRPRRRGDRRRADRRSVHPRRGIPHCTRARGYAKDHGRKPFRRNAGGRSADQAGWDKPVDAVARHGQRRHGKRGRGGGRAGFRPVARQDARGPCFKQRRPNPGRSCRGYADRDRTGIGVRGDFNRDMAG